MNELESYLYRKKITLREACDYFEIPIEDADIDQVETCSSCSIWFKPVELVPDLDGNPICKVCRRYYGM